MVLRNADLLIRRISVEAILLHRDVASSFIAIEFANDLPIPLVEV